MNPVRDIACRIALNFSLEPGQAQLFNECWELQKRKEDWDTVEQFVDAVRTTPLRAFQHLRDIVIRRAYVTETGHRYQARRPTAGRYVIFSDHHRTFAGHPNNFFDSANRGSTQRFCASTFVTTRSGRWSRTGTLKNSSSSSRR